MNKSLFALAVVGASLVSLQGSQANAGRFTAMIAASAQATRPVPSPVPTPVDPTALCDNCDGTGRVGDGTIEKVCPVCKGTGKRVATNWMTPDWASSAPADMQPTPWPAIAAGLSILQPKPDEVLKDFGVGPDARWLREAVKYFGTKQAVGVEIDPEVAAAAQQWVDESGMTNQIQIVNADSTTAEVSADIGVLYMWPEVLAALHKAGKITALDRCISYQHPVPELNMKKIVRGEHVFYLWEKNKPVVAAAPIVVPQVFSQGLTATVTPPPQQILQQFSAPTHQYRQRQVATYNGRSYSSPVCNSRNCSMCNSIRRQFVLTPEIQMIRLTLTMLLLVVVATLALVEDADASGHGYSNGGCSAAVYEEVEVYEEVGCSSGPTRRELRRARWAERRAARYSGCGNQHVTYVYVTAPSCSSAAPYTPPVEQAHGCSQSQANVYMPESLVYVAPPPTPRVRYCTAAGCQ